ncbi:MAG TPA: ABC transporter substrate-binding protein [Actinomycetota bacterium]|nr:ABC transporter substrate-binding protein [Actinomycetota bacterium]
MNWLKQVWETGRIGKFFVGTQYRSSVAGAIALLLVTSSMLLGNPETLARRPEFRPEQSDVTAAPVEELAPQVTDTAAVAVETPGAPRSGRTGPTQTKGGVQITTSAEGVPVADIFTPAEDRIGITNSQITLCTHAALSLGPAFDARPEDFDIYWRNLNDNGGVHGRKVQATFEDDTYLPDKAVLAAEECNKGRPFILGGGIGFDQIPAVRAWAENNHVLYMHHMASEDLSKKYSFSFFPTVNKTGEMFGEWIAKKHPGKKVGVVWRNSDNWKPGYTGFKETIGNAVTLVAELPVRAQQAVYSNEIDELERKGAEVVFFWENALMATDMIKQAKEQEFNPTWVVFPFNTTTDTLGAEAGDLDIEGISAWPAYSLGEYGGPFSAYADELRRFEAAQAKYGHPDSTPNDVLFMTWMAAKQMHQLLLDCGRDCTRNKIAGLLLTGRHKEVQPNCPLDFTRNGHVGGHTLIAMETYVKSRTRTEEHPLGTSGWRELERCKEHF